MEDQKKTILIADDDTFLLDMYALKFSQSGFAVSTATSAEEVVEKLKQSPVSPSVLVFDIMMPVVDGFELLERVQREKLAPDSLKIILSNLGSESDIKRGIDLGVDGYVIKASATPAEVVEKVQQILQTKGKK